MIAPSISQKLSRAAPTKDAATAAAAYQRRPFDLSGRTVLLAMHAQGEGRTVMPRHVDFALNRMQLTVV